MQDFFNGIYNKVLGFFHRTGQENAKDVARNRLRVVLMQDRTNLNPALLERMRKDLVTLLTKYLEMDQDALELNLEQDGDQMALMLSIPVIRAKDEDEINADEEIGKREEEAEEEADDEADEAPKPKRRRRKKAAATAEEE
jgi:cell division topological specificity factor